jgi:hypothetical protein
MPPPANRWLPTRGRVVLHVLRLVVAAVGMLLVLIGVLGPLDSGYPIADGMWMALLGAVLVTVSVLEQVRYRLSSGSSGGSLRPTEERFVDPTTGQRIQVWIDPASGERSYVPDGESPQK